MTRGQGWCERYLPPRLVLLMSLDACQSFVCACNEAGSAGVVGPLSCQKCCGWHRLTFRRRKFAHVNISMLAVPTGSPGMAHIWGVCVHSYKMFFDPCKNIVCCCVSQARQPCNFGPFHCVLQSLMQRTLFKVIRAKVVQRSLGSIADAPF